MSNHSTQFIQCTIGNQTFSRKPGLNLNCFPYKIHPPVKTFQGRFVELEELRYILTEKETAVVSGRGGVGKSELVRKYAWNNKGVYQKYMFWIKAESESSIGEAFKVLFKTFYDCDQNIDHFDINCIIENVYSLFDKPTLIVFDNATNPKIIYLPNIEEHTHIHTIITSQYNSWEDKIIINLSGVSENEAIDIFREIMSEKYNAERDEEHWKILAKQIGYLPLAIQIAASYINEESDEYNPEFNVTKYIEKLNKSAEILYEEENNDSLSLATTFDLTLEKITKHQIKKKLRSCNIIDVLNICAYLDPDFIKGNVLMKFFKEIDEDDLKGCLRTIGKFSLISTNGTNIFIHDEIQHILRYRQEKEKMNKDYFFQVLKLLIDDEDMFYHCRHAMRYADKHPYIAVEFYEKNKSSKYLKILTQYGCHEVLSKIFENMGLCYCCCCGTPYSKIKKHVLLYEAVLSRNVETVELLLKYSKMVNIKNEHGWTPLRLAVECKCFKIQELLLEHGASEEKTENGVTQLHECLRDGHVRLAYFLIDIPSVVNISDNDGNTPLHYTAKYPQLFENNEFIQVIKILLERVANINAVNNSMNTALHLAARHDNLQFTSLLIDMGAYICLQNNCGNTPLIEAALYNRRQIVMYLGENDQENKSVVIKNKKGFIALHYAVKLGFKDVAAYLAQKVNNCSIITDKKGNTSIHMAVIYKKNEILLKLLEATNINVNIVNNNRETPLKLAERSNNTEAINCLRTHMERFDGKPLNLEVTSDSRM